MRAFTPCLLASLIVPSVGRTAPVEPTLSYATYLGGALDDSVYDIAIDALGSVYVVGITLSDDLPVVRAQQPNRGGGLDGFVIKIDAAAAEIVYATYLGGVGSDSATSVAVDAAGHAFVTGTTRSRDFPIANPMQAELRGTSDAFLVELDADGQLVHSTFFGGSGADRADGIALDPSGGIVLTGHTASSDLPLVSAAQPALMSFFDAFVVRLAADQATLVYSTFLGGTETDFGHDVTVDAAGNAYVTGFTLSPDFPLLGAAQPTSGGLIDAFVTKLDRDGVLVYSTYLGGSSNDTANGIAVGPDSAVYVTGDTQSPDYPTVRPLQGFFSGDSDIFVTKLDPVGGLDYSTYLGTFLVDRGIAIAAGADGRAHFVGTTESPVFPTVSPIQPLFAGRFDIVVATIAADGSTLDFATFFGGADGELGSGLAVDDAGELYVAGVTRSDDLPILAPVQRQRAGEQDVVVVRIAPDCTAPGSVGNRLLLARSSPSQLTCSWTDAPLATGYTVYQDQNPSGPYATPSGSAVTGFDGVTLALPVAARLFYRVAGANPCGGEGPR